MSELVYSIKTVTKLFASGDNKSIFSPKTHYFESLTNTKPKKVLTAIINKKVRLLPESRYLDGPKLYICLPIRMELECQCKMDLFVD